MKFDFYKIIFFIVVISVFYSGNLQAEKLTVAKVSQNDTLAGLLNMDEDIRRQPWVSYQQLLSIKNTFSEMTKPQQLWWLLRKAQAENLLYFYDDFNLTVAQALTLIKPDTPFEIQSTIHLYQGIIHRREIGRAHV